METTENPHKIKFQIERIAFFSDAVFAIAITLMVIDLKPPQLKQGATFIEGLAALLQLLPEFIGITLSFFLISLFWWRHHKLMQHLNNYTNVFIWLNLFFLFSIMFIPFSTSFVFQNGEAGGGLTFLVYNLNYSWASASHFILVKYIMSKKRQLTDEGLYHDRRAMNIRLLYYPLFVYTVVSVLAFFTPLASVAYVLFAFVGLTIKIIKKISGGPVVAVAEAQ